MHKNSLMLLSPAFDRQTDRQSAYYTLLFEKQHVDGPVIMCEYAPTFNLQIWGKSKDLCLSVISFFLLFFISSKLEMQGFHLTHKKLHYNTYIL